MHFTISWQIYIGDYKLGFLDSVEINKSVELLANTCTIKIPATIYNKAIKLDSVNSVEGKIKRGNKVKVWLGYNQTDFTNTPTEFEGYMLNTESDNGSIIINCEDELFLLRKSVSDKQFKQCSIKQIAEYIVQQTGSNLLVDCKEFENETQYEKFVISKATGYDVLKKMKEETRANIYIKLNDTGKGVLHIHPPFTERHGYVKYSFQKNIESSDLKYKNADDKVLEVEVESTGKDGKKISVSAGKPGGDKRNIKVSGMSIEAMQKLANDTYTTYNYNGYEGGITTWLIPTVEPGYSAIIEDEEYQFKNGTYYVKSVQTSCSSSGISRKVDVGIKLNDKT